MASSWLGPLIEIEIWRTRSATSITSEVMVTRFVSAYPRGMTALASTPAAIDHRSFGELLRQWRDARGTSQLALSTRARVSTRHLSYLETGRASPSRDM